MNYALPGVKPWVRAAANEVGNRFGITTIGGIGARAYASDHTSGHALDFMVGADKARGEAVANYLIANASRLGITYIIWYKREWNPQRGWTTYSGTPDGNTSPTALHMDHVHASFSHTAPSGGGAPIQTVLPGVGDIPGVGGVIDAGQKAWDVIQAFTKVAEWLANPHNWLRIAEFATGAVLLVIALFNLDTVKGVASTAVKGVKNAG